MILSVSKDLLLAVSGRLYVYFGWCETPKHKGHFCSSDTPAELTSACFLRWLRAGAPGLGTLL